MRFFSSIRTKFALTYIAMIAFVLVLMNTYFLAASRDMIFDSKHKFVQNQAAIIVTNLEESFDKLTIDDVARVMARLDVAGVTYITITGADGRILYDTTQPHIVAELEFTAGYTERAFDGYEVLYSRFSGGYFSSSAFVPVMIRDSVIGVVHVHEEDRDQGEILMDMQRTLKNISIIAAVVSIAMIAFILWTVMRRITSIFRAIKSVREGEYSHHIKMRGNDELAMLSDEFNSLTGRLRSTDEIRRRFVADASHELRTPLASIRLLSDSIVQNESMDHDTIREFVSDIGIEAERLTRTTEKLMTLTKLDSDIRVETEVVDMRKVVISTLRMLRPLAITRDLALDSKLDLGCNVLATEDSIHQVVFNLVENAIKYNKPGGSVSVQLVCMGNHVELTVDDTGIGVPESDLPYIFDRFYRVDKARSQSGGGSGLGLAIVWDTVREHNGSVSAARNDAGGMRFSVRFALHDESSGTIA